MGAWETSPIAMSGNDLDVQEAVRAIGRLIETDTLAPATRAALLTARQALQGETADWERADWERADWERPSATLRVSPAIALFLNGGKARSR